LSNILRHIGRWTLVTKNLCEDFGMAIVLEWLMLGLAKSPISLEKGERHCDLGGEKPDRR